MVNGVIAVPDKIKKETKHYENLIYTYVFNKVTISKDTVIITFLVIMNTINTKNPINA